MIETIDPFLLKVAKTVETGAWHATYVEADDAGPAIAYTTGLWALFNAPEIVVCGLDEETSYALIDAIALAMKGGFRPDIGPRYGEFLEGADVAFARVDERFYELLFEHAVWFYGHHSNPPRRFPMLQCVLPHSQSGAMPWEDGYPAHLIDVQPVFGPHG